MVAACVKGTVCSKRFLWLRTDRHESQYAMRHDTSSTTTNTQWSPGDPPPRTTPSSLVATGMSMYRHSDGRSKSHGEAESTEGSAAAWTHQGLGSSLRVPHILKTARKPLCENSLPANSVDITRTSVVVPCIWTRSASMIGARSSAFGSKERKSQARIVESPSITKTPSTSSAGCAPRTVGAPVRRQAAAHRLGVAHAQEASRARRAPKAIALGRGSAYGRGGDRTCGSMSVRASLKSSGALAKAPASAPCCKAAA